MPKEQIEPDILLIQAEEWAQGNPSRTKLDSIKDAIFHLRHNKHLSYTSIKRFLEEAGIKTSTGALSKFYRSRFNAEISGKLASVVLARIAELKESKEKAQ